jgi:hypothetical protein
MATYAGGLGQVEARGFACEQHLEVRATAREQNVETRGFERAQDDAEACRERSCALLMRARERVRDVLEPHLGPLHALERANNIAQALALEDAQPDVVAFEMLRQLPGEARQTLAAAVRRAWLAAEYDEFRSRV